MEKTIFKIGDQVTVINTNILEGNEVGPPLKMRDKHKVHDIIDDRAGNQHLDVGLKSKFNYIRSFETKEELRDGDKIHWCHPSRFKITE